MHGKAGLLIFFAVILSLQGCSPYNYPFLKIGELFPGRAKVYVSNPSWAGEGENIYFIRQEIPFKYRVRQAGSLEKWMGTHASQLDFDRSRPCNYKLILLKQTGGKGDCALELSVLIEWSVPQEESPGMISFLPAGKDSFILKEVSVLGSGKYQVSETAIDASGLKTERAEKRVSYSGLTKEEKDRMYHPYLGRKSAVFSSDKKMHARLIGDSLAVFDESGQQLAKKDLLPGQYPHRDMQFSPDNAKLLFFMGRSICIFDVRDSGTRIVYTFPQDYYD